MGRSVPRIYRTRSVAKDAVAHELPALGRGGSSGVTRAEVEAVRVTIERERSEHGHGIGVVECERSHGWLATGDS